jgi:hypothetical protein
VCLDIIRLLWTRLRSVLKMQVEAILNGVFGHTLHWTLANLDITNPNFPRGDDANGAYSSAPTATSPGGHATGKGIAVEATVEEFTGQMIQMPRLYSTSFEILDCLVDLLAEETLLPDLYVNYDCDGNRSDLTQNIFDLLSQVVQQSHVACAESHEEAHFLWAQGIGDLALRGMFNALYVVYLRTERLQPRIGDMAGGTSSNAASDDDSHVDNLIDETGDISPTAVPYISADVLYKKRQRKKFFQHGIQEFNRKPLAGIKYLQQHSFLPTPLDSVSLATFLRSLPQGLRKDAVGVYLGGMGKEVKQFEKTEIHEADTMDFHREVLADFVRSFNFEGESVVAALRMFLASFRLPGEAQQIDRILNAFSLQVYEQCRDRFLMASVDVAYLLSFSLIMLNTDLHNPNIRPEKKMSLDDFIKNNKNYGVEVSHNQDLPNDFLTELYNTIANDEIKTFEDGGKHGEVTSDRWKDLLNQAESDPSNSRLIMHYSSSQLETTPGATSAEENISADAILSGRAKSGRSGQLRDSSVFASEQYDGHIIELVQGHLVRAFSSVFQQFVSASNASDKLGGGDSSTSGGNAANRGGMHYVPQKSTLQLACNGFVLGAAVASHLTLAEHCNAMFVRLCKYTALLSSDMYPVGYNGRSDGVWLFCSNQSAPIATAAVLKLVSTCSLSLASRSWKYFFRVVSGLREFRALPPRVLFPPEVSGELLSGEERREFVELVYHNKEELERKIALSIQESENAEATGGGFFSGMAWLLSALDSNLNASSIDASSRTGSSRPRSTLSPDFDMSLLSPTELSLHAEDLFLDLKPPRKDTSGDPIETADDKSGEFGSVAWIRATLAPYRLEFLVEDVSSLPCRALAEIIEALHDEILQVLRSPEQQPEQEAHGAASQPTTARRQTGGRRPLSQGGCVLFEHLLSQIIASSSSLLAGGADDDDGIAAILEAHYLQLLEFLRPILSTNASQSELSYENACFLLQKAINGLFSWVMRTQNAAGSSLLMSFIGALMELGDGGAGDTGDFVGDDSQTILRPFVTQLACGLARYVALVPPESLRYSRVEWLTVCCLISWSVSSRHAASHGFALLERLVTGQFWNVDGNEILVSDCYTKMLMFASKPRSSRDAWSARRPLELIVLMFDTLRPETSNYKEERLRFIGGVTVVCRDLLQLQDEQDVHTSQTNELIVAVLDALKHMVYAHCGGGELGSASFRGTAWLDLLRFGLVPIGFDLLTSTKTTTVTAEAIVPPPRRADANRSAEPPSRPFADNEEETNASFLYYRRQLPPLEVIDERRSPRASPVASRGTTRRRRPSVVKDPLALRPHVMTAQLLSLVVCEELQQMAACPKFAGVWEDVVTLLLGLLEQTGMNPENSGNTTGSSEAAPIVGAAALERRSVLSAHEEILEHARAIARRLAALQEKAPVQEGDAAASTDPSAVRALMEVLVDRCSARPGVFEELFPSMDEAQTPPVSGKFASPMEADEENGSEEEESVRKERDEGAGAAEELSLSEDVASARDVAAVAP